jgi:hypothetical protein
MLVGSRTAPCRMAGWRFLFLVAALAGSIHGQQSPATAGQTINHPALPGEFQLFANALGDRLQTPGKERMTLNGTITESSQSYVATVTYQLPNSVRIDKGGPQPRTLAFDGNTHWASSGSLSEQDRSEMESFLDDAAEVMFFSLSRGSGLRVIARHSRMDDGKAPQYAGPWANIYELMGNPFSQPTGTPRQKHFYFDAQTALPMLVRYRVNKSDGSVVLVETSWGHWSKINGQSVPGTVTRSEGGKPVLAFQISSATFGPAAQDGWFNQN